MIRTDKVLPTHTFRHVLRANYGAKMMCVIPSVSKSVSLIVEMDFDLLIRAICFWRMTGTRASLLGGKFRMAAMSLQFSEIKISR